MSSSDVPTRVNTGVGGLDEILHGGLIPERGYLVSGVPGTGKSILGVHFLAAGAERGETALYINLEESTENIRLNAGTLGFDLRGIEFLDLSPGSERFGSESTYSVFGTDQVEGPDYMTDIREGIDRIGPDRVFIDPITDLRYLVADTHQFRTQVIGLIQYLKERGATVVFSAESAETAPDTELQYLSDGSILLERSGSHRSISVTKFRGSGKQSGQHTLEITDSGLGVYPKLVVTGTEREWVSETHHSGVEELDTLLDGGIDAGTVTVLSGPPGVGKTTLGTQFLAAAGQNGAESLLYMFEETMETFRERTTALGLPTEGLMAQGTLQVDEILPFQSTPDIFAQTVTADVDPATTRLVMIDGVDGYRRSLNIGSEETVRELHVLLRYLKSLGIAVILVDTAETVTSESFSPTSNSLSFLADNIVVLRYLEIRGELRKAIGVLKMRTSDFEHSFREFAITERGIEVGEPWHGLRGILGGTPEFVDDPTTLDRSSPAGGQGQ